jgi:four helix bundle protein
MEPEHEFSHERLEVYQVARSFLAATVEISDQLPRGTAHIRDQLTRASDSLLLNLCEGAGRLAPKEKARFYEIAAGSGSECAGALDVILLRRHASPDAVAQARALLHRTVAMLYALARNWRRKCG